MPSLLPRQPLAPADPSRPARVDDVANLDPDSFHDWLTSTGLVLDLNDMPDEELETLWHNMPVDVVEALLGPDGAVVDALTEEPHDDGEEALWRDIEDLLRPHVDERAAKKAAGIGDVAPRVRPPSPKRKHVLSLCKHMR